MVQTLNTRTAGLKPTEVGYVNRVLVMLWVHYRGRLRSKLNFCQLFAIAAVCLYDSVAIPSQLSVTAKVRL